MKEAERKPRDIIEPVSLPELLLGKARNPFTASENRIIDTVIRYGVDKNREIAEKMGLSPDTIKNHRSNLNHKTELLYSGGGSDNFAKAIAISVIAGWVERQDTDLPRPLSKNEATIVFNLSFGFTKKDIIANNREIVNVREILNNLKRDFYLTSDYQVVGLGASIAKEKLLELRSNVL